MVSKNSESRRLGGCDLACCSSATPSIGKRGEVLQLAENDPALVAVLEKATWRDVTEADVLSHGDALDKPVNRRARHDRRRLRRLHGHA